MCFIIEGTEGTGKCEHVFNNWGDGVPGNVNMCFIIEGTEGTGKCEHVFHNWGDGGYREM